MIYLILGIFIFGLNVIPAFMPPTWIVLAFFYLHYHLNFFLTVFIGVLSATSGRVILAVIVRFFLRTHIPKFLSKNYEQLGDFFSSHQKLTIPIIFGYAFLPIPSNVVYILVGLSKFNLGLVAFSFMVGRLISYSFWISTSKFVGKNLSIIFLKYYSGFQNWMPIEALSIIIVLVVGFIDWRKIIK